jgi:hypothetical protein
MNTDLIVNPGSYSQQMALLRALLNTQPRGPAAPRLRL